MDNQLDRSGFIPFGFQYYRAPTPLPDQWQNDLNQIASMGFNCVKYWVQWRSNQPESDRFDFNDIQILLDLAQSYNLKVILNVIFDVAPAWFYRAYPEAKMVTTDNSVLEPQALSYRQLGGAPGPCYHHDEGLWLKTLFLQETVRCFRDHPALWAWDLWNEPELTTGIKRELSFANQVCYCSNSLNKFKEWLQDKYGLIHKLNHKWQRNYTNWSEIEPPRGIATYNDMVDWRLFFSDTLTSEMRRRVEAAKELDPVHPIMCHTVPFPIFNLITAGSDDFQLADECDMFGNSLGSSAWAADLLLSAAKSKKLINSEIHALAGNTALKPRKPEWKELKKHILIPLARGITGFLFWQYRPEILGHEAPAWGSTYLDGTPTPWLEEMALLNLKIQEHQEELNSSKRPSDGVAILFSVENQIANFSVYSNLDLYQQSLQGTHRLLHDLNYKVEFIHQKDVSAASLARLHCLWLPFPLYLDLELARAIQEWVANGGILISECSFGAIQAENGLHSYQVPAYDFDEVFGLKEKWIHSVEALDHSYHNITKLDYSNALIPLQTAFTTPSEASRSFGGVYYRTDVEVQTGVDVWATYSPDQMAAITCRSYGRGKAVWVGSLLGAAYWINPAFSTLQFFKEMLQEKLSLRPYLNGSTAGVRVDILESDTINKALLFVQNLTHERQLVQIYLPLKKYSKSQNWFRESEAELANDNFSVEIAPDDIQVFSVSS